MLETQEGKSAVKTLGKKHLFGVNCICKCLDTQILDSQEGHKYITWTESQVKDW